MRRLALVVCLVACHRERKAEVAPPWLEVEVAGCAAVLQGPICELGPDRVLRVFVPGTTTATFSAPATELRAFPEGKLHRVVVPAGTTSLTVDKEGKRFAYAIAREPAYPWIFEARALRRNDPEAARGLAKAHLSSKDPTARALALGLVARLDLAKGNVDEAIARFRESIGLHTVRISDRVEDTLALSFALNQRSRRYGEARAALDAIEPIIAYPEGSARLTFNRGEVALEAGDLRSAIRRLREARAHAEHLGMTRDERNARGLLATVLQDLGRVEEGIEELRALDRELTADPEVDGCQRLEALLNLALSIERRDEAIRDRGETTKADELSPATGRALALIPSACPDPHLHAITKGLAASAALARGDLPTARAVIGAAKPKDPRTNDVLQVLDLEARLALAEGDAKSAAAKYELAVGIAETSHQIDMVWRALVGRARALDALGNREGALQDSRRAETMLDDLALALPLDEARGSYLSRSEKSARLAIDLLLREHRDAEAFMVARRARARLLTSVTRSLAIDALDPKSRRGWEDAIARFRAHRAVLDRGAENDWQLAAPALAEARAKRASDFAAIAASLDDALSALGPRARASASLAGPRPGELWFGFHRSLRGPITFVATSEGVHARAASEDLFAPYAAAIAKATRIVLFPDRETRAIDLHARLLDQAPVVYALDVPHQLSGETGEKIGLVGDPTSDLPAAASEAKEIQSLYKGALHSLLGNAASSGAVLDLLAEVSTFHYAGHGVFGGADGAESRLPLASGTQLGVLDVLAAAHVPRLVILSACESARSVDHSLESFGIAQAFAVAGSDIVIAPTRVVGDDLARRVAVALHRALIEGGLLESKVDAVEALRNAQRAIRAVDPTSDWAAFRAIRP